MILQLVVNFIVKNQLFMQIIRFILWGLIPTFTDVILLVILNEILGIRVLISSAISFLVSVTISYFISMRFVFNGGSMKRTKEYILFVLLSLGGLLINQGIMWIGTGILGLHYLLAKLMSVVIVPAYNFISKKLILER